MYLKNGFTQIILLILLSITIIATIGYFSLKNGLIRSRDNFKSPAKVSPTLTIVPNNSTDNWKTYRNEKLGFEFQYPSKLKLTEKKGFVSLNHSIPYDNYGDCDMIVGEFSKTLNDFDTSFEVKERKDVEKMQYIDGAYEEGILKGKWQYTGAEGCGGNLYYFELSNDKILVVTQNIAQAFTGNSTMWDMDKILNTPGVIRKEESDQLFRQILSTFKVIEPIKQITLPIKVLETGYGIETTSYKYPSTVKVNVTAKYEQQIAAYGAGEKIIIGPKEWTGKGYVAADGNTYITLSAQSPSDSSIKLTLLPACYSCILESASPFFPAAEKKLTEDGLFKPEKISGLTIENVNDKLIKYEIKNKSGVIENIGVAYYNGYFMGEEINIKSFDKSFANELLNIFIKQYLK